MSLRQRLAASTVWPMLWKEFIQMRRDRLTLGMMLGIPAIQLVLFGYAIQTEVRHLPTVVLDESRSTESRRWWTSSGTPATSTSCGYVADRKALDREIRGRPGHGRRGHPADLPRATSAAGGPPRRR